MVLPEPRASSWKGSRRLKLGHVRSLPKKSLLLIRLVAQAVLLLRLYILVTAMNSKLMLPLEFSFVFG